MKINFPSESFQPEKEPRRARKRASAKKSPVHVHIQKVAALIHQAVPLSAKKQPQYESNQESLPHYVSTFARFLRESTPKKQS